MTDRLEIGGALPLVQLHIEGIAPERLSRPAFVQASGTADASGVADAAVRAKYLLVSAPTAGFAVGRRAAPADRRRDARSARRRDARRSA